MQSRALHLAGISHYSLFDEPQLLPNPRALLVTVPTRAAAAATVHSLAGRHTESACRCMERQMAHRVHGKANSTFITRFVSTKDLGIYEAHDTAEDIDQN
jgi:hypothetical protein